MSEITTPAPAALSADAVAYVLAFFREQAAEAFAHSERYAGMGEEHRVLEFHQRGAAGAWSNAAAILEGFSR